MKTREGPMCEERGKPMWEEEEEAAAGMEEAQGL